MLRIRINTDFITLDENIYGIHSKRAQISSMYKRHDVAPALMRRCIKLMSPLGCSMMAMTNLLYSETVQQTYNVLKASFGRRDKVVAF